MSPSNYNDLLLRLYRLSHELPLDHFQDEALDLVKLVLPFDSSMWGSATLTDSGIDVHTIHLHEQPPEMLQAYEEVKHLDTAAMQAAQHLTTTMGFHADSWFCDSSQKALRAYGKRFEQSHFFISSTVNPVSRFCRWLTLFRSDPSAYGTDTERLLLATLMPHIQQALELNRLTHLNRSVLAENSPLIVAAGSAIADVRGVMYHMDPSFEQAVRTEWDDWGGHALPSRLMQAFGQSPTRFIGRTLVLSLRIEHQLLFLKSRARCAADNLSPKEFTVAQLMATGNTHKQIAGMLQRSPSTVRNQIRSVYDKLGIGNVAGLASALRLME